MKSNHPDAVHICTNCGRNFADNQKLLQHLASHARSGKGRKCMPANYNCPHCPREFNRKRHMELHVLFKHSQGILMMNFYSTLLYSQQTDPSAVNSAGKSLKRGIVSTFTCGPMELVATVGIPKFWIFRSLNHFFPFI